MKQTEEQKTFLRTDYLKRDRLTTEATRLCRLVNDRVLPALTELGLFSTEKALYYTEDSDRVYTDYKSKVLQGIDNLPKYIQRMAEENANDELYNIVGDGWGNVSVSADMLKVTEWRNTENGEQLCANSEAINELCKVFVEADEQEAYNKLQGICSELNALTADRGLSGYEHIIFCPVGGVWQINGNINLKALK